MEVVVATVHELLFEYGASVATRNAGLFVGAGLSKPTYPTWKQLLDGPIEQAALPDGMADLALAAEYYVQSQVDGRARLEESLLSHLAAVDPTPHAGHRHVADLPITELWTTNYDRLLEQAMPDAQVVMTDDDLLVRRRAGQRRIVKLHGSFDVDPPRWQRRPVITRTDYERYEQDNPRLWASLTADFLTRPLLFLGFGFTDPNVDVLLRLARTLRTASSHFTVMRRPSGGDEEQDRLLFDHRVRDLENSGVGVVEIDEYDEINRLLAQLVRRTRPPQLFVSGSYGDADGQARATGEAVGERLVCLGRDDEPVRVASLAGPAGRHVSYAFATRLRETGNYDPSQIEFHFRRKEEPPDSLDERTGTALHWDLDQDSLRRRVIDRSRAMLVVAGGGRTGNEVEVAEELGVAVVPLAVTGGTAARVWRERVDTIATTTMGARPVKEETYRRLASEDLGTAADAAVVLLEQAMYLGTGAS